MESYRTREKGIFLEMYLRSDFRSVYLKYLNNYKYGKVFKVERLVICSKTTVKTLEAIMFT